jgi:hypothetical protein
VASLFDEETIRTSPLVIMPTNFPVSALITAMLLYPFSLINFLTKVTLMSSDTLAEVEALSNILDIGSPNS